MDWFAGGFFFANSIAFDQRRQLNIGCVFTWLFVVAIVVAICFSTFTRFSSSIFFFKCTLLKKPPTVLFFNRRDRCIRNLRRKLLTPTPAICIPAPWPSHWPWPGVGSGKAHQPLRCEVASMFHREKATMKRLKVLNYIHPLGDFTRIRL